MTFTHYFSFEEIVKMCPSVSLWNYHFIPSSFQFYTRCPTKRKVVQFALASGKPGSESRDPNSPALTSIAGRTSWDLKGFFFFFPIMTPWKEYQHKDWEKQELGEVSVPLCSKPHFAPEHILVGVLDLGFGNSERCSNPVIQCHDCLERQAAAVSLYTG